VVFANQQQSIHDQNPSSVKFKIPQNTFANVEFMATPLRPLNSDLDRFGMAWIDFFQGGWCAFSDIMPSSMM
jgi:hypothetical protein